MPTVLAPCVPAAIGRTAQSDPGRTAVLHGGTSTSYGELWRASERVASVLAEHGVAVGDRVCLRLGRGADAVAAMLGVLRAGATYVPLDDADPPARRAHAVEAVDPVVVLVDMSRAGGSGAVREVLLAPGGSGKGRAHPGDEMVRAPMYVMFTSGSTGIPKGVVVEQPSVLALVADPGFGFSRDTVMTHVASLAFDASTLEVWGPLCHGGQVVVLDLLDLLGDADRLSCLPSSGVTTTFVTTALLNHLLQHRAEGMFGLDTVLFGGERADVKVVQEWLRRRGSSPTPRLVNCYGPTEATVISTMAELGNFDVDDVPIGVPLDHVTAVVVGEDGRVRDEGEPGELLLMGPCLAAGYWGDPAATNSKFVEVDLGDGHRGRAYRTGDVCTWRDGQLHFVGREDDLVKLRGHRVDLGEVEVAMRRLHGVREAKVLAVGAGPEMRLVGFFEADEAVTARDVRKALREVLPAFMVPLDLRRLVDVPLTGNVKTDAARLRALAARP